MVFPQETMNVIVPEKRRDLHCGPAFAVGDARVRPGAEKPFNFANVAAQHRRMQQRVAERTLKVWIADRLRHAP